jgi:DNA-binding LytR/AlgR family response regulator
MAVMTAPETTAATSFHRPRNAVASAVTNGAAGGPDGDRARSLLIGWLIISAVTVGVTVLNVMTVQADNPGITSWKPWTWEGTSAVMMLLAAWLPGVAVQAARQSLGRILVAHLVALLAFSGVHVFGMMALRHLIYALAHETYGRTAIESFVYEFRKDLITYGVFAATYWIVFRERGRRASLQTGASTFDIRDGGRLMRVATADILAAKSAENYVEFVLADGRRPLMRTTLAEIETRLAPAGFVRTHRSWLVNRSRVTGLKPQGSGDWLVELGAAAAPLSRRHVGALAKLAAPE